MLLLFLLVCACGAVGGDDDASAQAPSPRIVTLAPHLAELAVAAGAEDHLVGVSAYSDFPDSVSRLPIVSDGFRMDPERLLAVSPDLVLAWGGGGQSRMIELARSLDIDVIEQPGRRLIDVATSIRAIGAIVGTQSTAEAAAMGFEQSLERVASEPLGLNVFYQISEQPIYTVGGEHFISDVIELCGGSNIFASLSEAAPAVALEAVIAADPDIILTAEGALDSTIALWSRWPELKAVHNRNVIGVPSDWVVRAGPRLALGAEAICAALKSAADRRTN